MSKINGIKGDRWRYKPGQNKVFPISRSKFGEYLKCKRCFYLNTIKGLKSPSMPGWPLNSATDEMLKFEFDIHRKNQTQHPEMKKNNSLKNVVPFQHKDIDEWRRNFGGFKVLDKDLNLELKGAIDDVWIDLKSKELIIVDYKSTSKKEIKEDAWLADEYSQDYLKQMNFYKFIFEKAGHKVRTTFFYIVNGLKKDRPFNNSMEFEPHLIEYQPSTKQIPTQLQEMKKLMDSKILPDINSDCESCNYLNAGKHISKIEDLDLEIESLLTLVKSAKKNEINKLEKRIKDLENKKRQVQYD